MASVSSSAVLELKDEEDTDAETLADTPGEVTSAPLIMEHGYDIAVKVDAPMKQLSTLETFVTYRVRCVCARWPAPPAVRRRYNHFKELHSRLAASHLWLAPPPLPPLHSARQQLDRYSRGFVQTRALALHAFLDRVAKHPILTHSEDFRIFLTTPDEEIDKVFKSENSAMNLWGLSAALWDSGSSDAKPVNGARVKDPEFSAASDYLQSLQHKLTALCALTTKLYKGSAALATEYKGMTNACSTWASSERSSVSLALTGAARGAGGAAAARGRPAVTHRALLPMLAAYAAAHAQKIRQRDAAHAAYVSGANSTDEMHNKLEQASEALRSELSDWNQKTRSDIKSILLDLAEKQVIMHQQTLMGWEHALNQATESNEGLFKTVSKTAVQNLSPTKAHMQFEEPSIATEKDLEDLDIENDSNDGSDFQDLNSRANEENLPTGVESAVLDLSESYSDVENAKLKTDSLDGKKDDSLTDEVSKLEDMSKLDLTGVSVTSDPLQEFADVDLTDAS
ncbi:sorting nexin-7 [Plutella xylostella]|uniref:sorting nexin-7 n=1 Tax=Plutella xylostella TaxID=51655 RepID=UPI002032266C|nr:sorting nexin-7 [Plutella xylostella]